MSELVIIIYDFVMYIDFFLVLHTHYHCVRGELQQRYKLVSTVYSYKLTNVDLIYFSLRYVARFLELSGTLLLDESEAVMSAVVFLYGNVGC